MRIARIPIQTPLGNLLALGTQTYYKAPGDLQFEVETLCVGESVPQACWL